MESVSKKYDKYVQFYVKNFRDGHLQTKNISSNKNGCQNSNRRRSPANYG